MPPPASRLPGFPASRLPRFPASRLPGFPAFRLPASQLFCFPAFWLPSPFSPSLPPSPPSPPSLLLLCLRPLSEPPVFCPLWMEWRGRGPCPDAVWPLPAVFWGVASRIPRVPPAFGWRVREGKLRRALDVGCGAGPLVGRSGPLVRAAAWCLSAAGADTEMEPPDMKKSAAPSVGSGAFVLHFTGRGGQSGLSAAVRSGEVALPVGLGFRCGPRVAGPFSGRVGPRHGDGTAVHEKSAAPDVESGAFALCFAGLGLAQTVIISFSLRSRTPSSSLVNFSSSFCVCVSPSFDSSSGMPSF